MRVRPSRIFCYAIAMISFVIVFAGCAQQRLNLKEDNPQAVTALATLRAVTVSGDTSRVEISADSPLVYTSYKLTNPPKAVIDLAQTEPGSVSSPIGVGKGSIKQISVTRHAYGESVLTRIEIALSGDEDFSVDKDTGDKTRLAVIITRPNEQKEAKKSEADTKPAAPELKTAQANTGEVSQKDIASLPPVVKPAAPPHPAEAG